MKYIRTTPFEHQEKAFELGISLPSFALLMEQGTGKTLPAIGLIGERAENHNVKKVLIVCPKSVISEWERQLTEHADFPFLLTDRESLVKKPRQLEIYITNYRKLWELTGAGWATCKDLKSWKPDMVIVDESQNIKNYNTHQSKAIYQLGKTAKYRLILTGTPVTKSPLDFFSQYKFLDENIFGKSYPKFRETYAVMGGYMNKKPVDFINLDDLVDKVYSVAYRVTQKQILNIPALDQRVYATLEPKAQKYYEQMKKEALLILKEGIVTAPIVLTQLLRLQQIAGGYLKVEDTLKQVSKAKLDALQETIENLGDRKIVIFARFIAEVEGITQLLEKMKIASLKLTGKTKDRGKVIEVFQQTDRHQVLVSQISVGGVGITLTAADTIIFYSTDFSLTNLEQAKARIRRIGQTSKHVNFIYLICEDTVDEDVMERLIAKKDLANLVVDELREIAIKMLKGIKS